MFLFAEQVHGVADPWISFRLFLIAVCGRTWGGIDFQFLKFSSHSFWSQEDLGLVRGRPLYLSHTRYGRIQELWRKNLIAKEVTRIRCDSERVIREDYY